MKMMWGWPQKEATVESIKGCAPEGWGSIIEELLPDLEKLGWDGMVYQVKEKFGGLRFYIGGGTTEIFNRIHEAESKSFTVCQDCGNPGFMTTSGYWLSTLCQQCCDNRGNTKMEEEE